MNKRIIYIIFIIILLIFIFNLNLYRDKQKIILFCEEYYNNIIDNNYEKALEQLYFSDDKQSHSQSLFDFYATLKSIKIDVIECEKISSKLYQVKVKIQAIYNDDLEEKEISDYVNRLVFLDENKNYRIVLNHDYLPTNIANDIKFNKN